MGFGKYIAPCVYHYCVIQNNFTALKSFVLKDSLPKQMHPLERLQIPNRKYLNNGRKTVLILIPAEAVFFSLNIYYCIISLISVESRVYVTWNIDSIFFFISQNSL